MKCPHCGKEVPEEKRFCGFCGEPIAKVEENARTVPLKKDRINFNTETKTRRTETSEERKTNKDALRFSFVIVLFWLPGYISLLLFPIWSEFVLLTQLLVFGILTYFKIKKAIKKTASRTHSVRKIALIWIVFFLINVFLFFSNTLGYLIYQFVFTFVAGFLTHKVIWKSEVSD